MSEVFFNPVAQVKFVHTVAAAYVTASMFVLGISALYLLKKRDQGFALRSFAIASAFGLASALSVVVLGDESGYESGEVQKVKLAAIEAEWKTEPAPASFTVVGLPHQEDEQTNYAVKIPYVMGIIATRSLDKEVMGLTDLKNANEARIRNGMVAYGALEQLRNGPKSDEALALFNQHKADLGYGLLLKKYTADVVDASEAQIISAAKDTIPHVATIFWSFRGMVALGFWFILVFIMANYYLHSNKLQEKRWFLKVCLWSIPLPWVAAELGWIVAEMGRQPWTISGILPTHLSVSQLDISQVWFSLAGLLSIYTLLFIVEMYLMLKYIKLGPASLKTGRYFGESDHNA